MHTQGIAMPPDGEAGKPAVLDVAALLSDPALLGAALTALMEKTTGQLVPVQAADPRPDLPALLTPKQVHELTGISRSEVHRILQSGAVPSLTVGNGTKCVSRRVPKALIVGFLAEQTAGNVMDLKEYAAIWKARIPAPAAPQMRAAS